MKRAEDGAEATRQLRAYDRAAACLAELGVDVAKARPVPLRAAARGVLAAYQTYLDTDNLDVLRDALTELQEALGEEHTVNRNPVIDHEQWAEAHD